MQSWLQKKITNACLLNSSLQENGDCNKCCVKTLPKEVPKQAPPLLHPETKNLPPAADTPLDLLVIGAGPHSLSLLSRLIDDEPDLLTESERAKIMKKSTR